MKSLCTLFLTLPLLLGAQGLISQPTGLFDLEAPTNLERDAVTSKNFSVEAKGIVYPREIKEDWAVQLTSVEAPSPGGNSYRSFLQSEKAKLPKRIESQQESLSKSPIWVPKPKLLRNWQGNPYSGSVPNDNDCAISNGGKLVSVRNTNISFYDIGPDTLLANISLGAFATSLGLPNGKYDPKVRYDPIEDKFVMVYLNGFNDSTSWIVVAFSTTNNPMDPWNLYALSGDPNNNGLWSDYPIIALTNDELFITINSLYNDSAWQVGFVETLVWQIDKSDGFMGASLNTMVHSGISFGGKSIRNLCLVQGGSSLAGPDMYLLSNRNFDSLNDTIFIVHISGNIGSGPTFTVGFSISPQAYGLSPNARQVSSHTFDTNDSRILGAYIEDGRIHFVSNSRDPISGTCGVFHGRIENLGTTNDITASIISAPNLDFGYPNISYTGTASGEDHCIISYNHSGPDSFPGFSAQYFVDGTYSERKSIVQGTSLVNILSGTYERWGDYSGSQRVYNDPSKVWVAGYWSRQTSGFPSQRRNEVWLAELEAQPSSITNLEPPVVESSQSKPTVSPNPSRDIFFLEFEMAEKTILDFQVFDVEGKLVKHLLTHTAKGGKNHFQFSLDPLSPGNYFLVGRGPNGVLIREPIVKQ